MVSSALAGSAPDLERKRRMEAFAKAAPNELADFAAGAASLEVYPVRGPETGLVMVRGRIGGGGAAFNLGEVTVSRATVRLASGEIGHGQLLGNDRSRARLAALADALAQTEAFALAAMDLCERIEARVADEDARRVGETAATRVDFFTMVRGDD